jgi:hypothetical protein
VNKQLAHIQIEKIDKQQGEELSAVECNNKPVEENQSRRNPTPKDLPKSNLVNC